MTGPVTGLGSAHGGVWRSGLMSAARPRPMRVRARARVRVSPRAPCSALKCTALHGVRCALQAAAAKAERLEREEREHKQRAREARLVRARARIRLG